MNSIKNVNNGGLDLQPNYQRGFIWGPEFKNKLIYSVIKKYPIGSISIRELNSKNPKGALQEVVDGQQRLTTLYNLRAGEIINSIPETHLQKYLDKIQDLDKLMSILGYSNNRREFDKLFYSIIGLYDKQINFGTTNKCIKEYVFNKKTDLEGQALTQTLKMINNLNKILSTECKFKANKRFIKMLLLLAGFEAIDFDDNLDIKLRKLDKINNMLSSFNSAERDIVNKTFVGFNDKEIEEYRLIALFNKGAQTYRITKERIFSLADKIINDKKISAE